MVYRSYMRFACLFLMVITHLSFSDQSLQVQDTDHPLAVANRLMGHESVVWSPGYVCEGRGDHAVLAFHGLSDVPHAGYASLYRGMKVATVVPSMPYSADYLDARNGIISFGGAPDLVAALIALNDLYQAGYRSVCVYGLSCGGAVAVNLVHALQHPDRYAQIFTQLHLDPAQLLSVVKCCILDRPFSSYGHISRAKIGVKLPVKKLVQGILGLSGNRVDCSGKEPLELVQDIKGLPILLCAAMQDRVVGYRGVIEMYAHLKKKNNRHVALIKAPIGHDDRLPQRSVSLIRKFVNLYCKV